MLSPDSKGDGEKEECAWCKFMKGGPCRAVFETWQSCVDSVADGPEGAADEEARKQAVEKCAEVTGPLFDCLVRHPDYYGPQLDSMKQREKESKPESPAAAETSSRRSSSSSNNSHHSKSSMVANVQSGFEPDSVGGSKLGAAVL